MRNRIGFKPSWITAQEEQEEVVTTHEPLTVINNTAQAPSMREMYPDCSDAHIEVKNRMVEVAKAMTEKKYSRCNGEKKVELINELIWLTTLDAELTLKDK
jgi:7-cyano-7-deazaguanine synthase in queuosine biosynthesis